jgi:hypothetical protein
MSTKSAGNFLREVKMLSTLLEIKWSVSLSRREAHCRKWSLHMSPTFDGFANLQCKLKLAKLDQLRESSASAGAQLSEAKTQLHDHHDVSAPNAKSLSFGSRSHLRLDEILTILF